MKKITITFVNSDYVQMQLSEEQYKDFCSEWNNAQSFLFLNFPFMYHFHKKGYSQQNDCGSFLKENIVGILEIDII